MNTAYSILFSVELLHEYNLNLKCNDLEIVPAEDCRQISKRMNIQWRNVDNRLLAFIKENELHEPFTNIPPAKTYHQYYDKTVFRFYIKIKNPDFVNYTNVDLSFYNPRKILYFSNLAKNSESGALYLSLPVNEYANGKTYLPGSMVKDPTTDKVFEAIKKHIPKKKSQLNDISLWAPKGLAHLSKSVEDHVAGKTYLPGELTRKPATDEIYQALSKHTAGNVKQLDDKALWNSRGNGSLQYPTGNDVIEFTHGNYNFQLPSAIKKADITVSGFNFNNSSPAFDVPVIPVQNINFEKPSTQVPVNLSSQSPGKYEIKVNKETRVVYFDPLLNEGNILGVIEIFNHLPGNDEYAVVDEDEKIKYPKYQIQFANRRVLWKYVRKDGKAESITDIGETGYVFVLNGDAFVSELPIPLSENVLKTLKLEFNSKDFRLFPLPNPQVQRLGRYKQDDYDYLCSEVYLNY